MLIGYARVSTEEQDTDMQVRLLRPALAKALQTLKPGDTLIFYKLDRLARSIQQLLEILAKIEAAGASVKSLTEPFNTDTAAGRMMMHMLGCFAEFERSIIRERTKAGLQAARARGQKLGRHRALDPFDEAELVNMYLSGWYTHAILADMFDVNASVVKRAIYRRTKPTSSSLN
jgi:DNA invertase Pin-like site-specific DNA recombinase